MEAIAAANPTIRAPMSSVRTVIAVSKSLRFTGTARA